jgi:hypothetical protein
MAGPVRLAAALSILGLSGCAYLAPLTTAVTPTLATANLLACRGDFGQFANGFIVARPMELDFAVYWDQPAIFPLNGGGSPARGIAINSLGLSFEVQYPGYRAAYHLNRVDGTFSQQPGVGGVYFGRCELRPLETRV